jgi:hypothetical protein
LRATSTMMAAKTRGRKTSTESISLLTSSQ